MTRRDSSPSRRQARKSSEAGDLMGTTASGSEHPVTTPTTSEGKSDITLSALQLPQEDVMRCICGDIAARLQEKAGCYPSPSLASTCSHASVSSMAPSLPSAS